MKCIPLEAGDINKAAIAGIGIVLMLIVLIVMTISGFILLIRWIKQKRFVLDESMPDFIPQNEVLKTVYLNPGVILLFVIEIFGIITDLFNIDLKMF